MSKLLVALALFVQLAPARAQQAFPPATPESQAVSADALAELVAEVRGYLERDLLVGAELLVVKNRHTLLHEVFGFSDREQNTAWELGAVCNIRSMTKPLTGAAAQILIDRGELGIDDLVADYLPGFANEAAGEITVRQLLTHRSGLPLTILTSLTEFEDLQSLANAAGARGPEFEPDSKFWYSDCGSNVLGAVVEVAAGQKLDEFVRKELLEPLGMKDSFYFIDDEDPRRARIASLYVGGAQHWTRFLNPDDGAFYPFAWGSQTLYSTPPDYARFLAMWMDGGRVGERVVLSPAAVERTLTPVSEMSMLGSDQRFPTSFKGLEVYYGQMSVLHVPLVPPVPQGNGQKARPGPARSIGHSGSDGTIAWAFPQLDLMVLYFTQSRGGSTALRLEASIDRLLVNPGAYGADDELPEELRPYLGTYIADWANHMREEFVVQGQGDKLALDIPTQMVYALAPAEEGRWTFAVAPEVKVWFGNDATGEVDRLMIQQGPMTFEAPRKGSARERELAEKNKADPERLGKYLGTYEDSESDGLATVLIDADYLAIRGADGNLFHLWEVPGQNAWVVRENPVVILTFQEEDGRVVSVTRGSQLGGESKVMPRVE